MRICPNLSSLLFPVQPWTHSVSCRRLTAQPLRCLSFLGSCFPATAFLSLSGFLSPCCSDFSQPPHWQLFFPLSLCSWISAFNACFLLTFFLSLCYSGAWLMKETNQKLGTLLMKSCNFLKNICQIKTSLLFPTDQGFTPPKCGLGANMSLPGGKTLNSPCAGFAAPIATYTHTHLGRLG